MSSDAWRRTFDRLRDWPSALGVLPAACALFEPLTPPEPGEWLAIHEEHGQSFDQYVASTKRPGPGERTIYLQPTDEIPGLADTCLQMLAAFTRAFFCLDVRVLPAIRLDMSRLSTRVAHDTRHRQVCAGDIVRQLLASRPADAFCVLGITSHDIYPHPILGFAFGGASMTHRVGICSVARFGPPFCEDAPNERQGAMRRRCCRVIAHEIGHMAGIAHCVYFRCLMNGSSSLAESERRPLHLCPIDLEKLRWLLGCDPADHFARLHAFWRDVGDEQEAARAAAHLETFASGRAGCDAPAGSSH